MNTDIITDPILRDVPEIDGYKVLKPCVLYARVGAGGMGAVYRGKHVKLNIDVGVKCLLPHLALGDGQLVTRFEREARLAAMVNHPNLVRVFDIDKKHGVHYLVMEFVRGETARERVTRKEVGLPLGEAVTIVLQAARGLAAAHDKGIVHRDIKPDNILISKSGKVKLADLGLGQAEREGSDAISEVTMGTPRYMPPEQWDGLKQVGPTGDVWALGATLYFLLVGKDAYDGDSRTAVMRRVCLEPFPDITSTLPDLPPRLVEIIKKSTERDQNARFADAAELVAALEELAVEENLRGSLSADPETGTGTSRCELISPPPPELLAKVRVELETERGTGKAKKPKEDMLDEDDKTLLFGNLEDSGLAERQARRSNFLTPRNAIIALVAMLIVVGGLAMLKTVDPGGSEKIAESAEIEPGDRDKSAPPPAATKVPERDRPSRRKPSKPRTPRTTQTSPSIKPAADEAGSSLQVVSPKDMWVSTMTVTLEGTVEDLKRGDRIIAVDAEKKETVADIDGDTWRVEVNLQEQLQIVKVKLVDPAGREKKKRSVMLQADPNPPEIFVLEPEEEPFFTNESEFNIRVKLNDAGEIARATIDGDELPVSGGDFEKRVTLEGEGEHSFEIVAIDKAGNKSTQTVRITRDKAKPALQLLEPSERIVPIVDGKVKFRGTVQDESRCDVQINGTQARVGENGAWDVSIPFPPGEELRATIIAIDRAGNRSEPLTKIYQRDREIREAPALEGFKLIAKNPQGNFEYTHEQSGIVMVLLKGGLFWMGSPEGEAKTMAAEQPRHKVLLDAFLIAKYEISQAEWKRVMGRQQNPSLYRGDNLPVERLSWHDCDRFTQAVEPKLALPTEAQWEYACRAGTETPFAFGATITTDQVNYDGNFPYGDTPKGPYRNKTVPVDSFQPNTFGLFNMHGNVWEWCQDVYDADFYGSPGAIERNPLSLQGSAFRVLRGGDFYENGAFYCRSAYRRKALPSDAQFSHGFRPVCFPLPRK